MNDYIPGRKSCVACGSGGVPLRLSRIEDGDYREFQCPTCGHRLVAGIVTTDGEPGQSPTSPPPTLDDLMLPMQGNWRRVEVWWGNGNHVGAIHGKPVIGDERFYAYICKMESTYERS